MILEILSAHFAFAFNSIYWLKWSIAYIYIRVHCYLHKKRFDVYDVNDPKKTGVLFPQLEKDLESPFPEHHLKEATDEILFYGVHTKSEYLFVRIERKCGGLADAIIQLKMADGRTFHLVESAGVQQDGKTGFSCGRLHMRYLLPMRSWRIHFCGLISENASIGKSCDGEKFVKFVFLWKASSDVYDLNFHSNPRGIASAMARSSWKFPLMPPVDGFADELNLYAQSGTLAGTVSVEEGEETEMYLFGEKIRNLGRRMKSAGVKSRTVIGKTPENGFTFHAADISVPNLVDKLPYGFIVRGDTNMDLIADVQITINSGKNTKQAKIEFHTRLAEDKFDVIGMSVGDQVKLYENGENNRYLSLIFMEFMFKGKKGFGFLMIRESYKEAKISYDCSLPYTPVSLPETCPLTVKFTDKIAKLEHISGGKGASLAKLSTFCINDHLFIVPKGIVITTEAFKEFLNNEIRDAVKELEDVVFGNTKGDVKEACHMVSNLILNSHMPEKLCNSITQDLKSVFCINLMNLRFAVRSSAVGEDTECMSAAGQMDTLLGVQGLQNVFTATKQCWASQFGHIAVEYKRHYGQPLMSPMAVVVQEMVGCDVAGVLFTCDPVTGNPSRMVISANYGLGETVVSGKVEPDHIVLKRSLRDEIDFDTGTIGGKHEKLILKESGGTVTEELDETTKGKSCLSNDMAIKLGQLGIRVEKYYKSPRDIEWGIVGDQIYLLQARHITSITSETTYEMVHEFDTAMHYENEYYTMANVGEIMPSAITPLSVEFFFKNFCNSVEKALMKKGVANNAFQSKYFMTGCALFYNHMMLTAVEMMIRNGYNTLASKGFIVSILGRLLDDPDLHSVAKEMASDQKKSSSFLEIINFYWDMFTYDSGIEEIKKKILEMDVLHEDCNTSIELLNALVDDFGHYDEIFFRLMNTTENSSHLNNLVFTILLQANNQDFNTDMYSDFSRLLVTYSEVESANVPHSLKNLANQIEKDIDCDIFKKMVVEDAESWLKTSNTFSTVKFKEFIERHGHRCIMEYDIRSMTWEVDSKPLVRLLQNLCGACKAVEKTKENFDTIISGLNVSLSFFSKLILRFLLSFCQNAIRNREMCKSLVIKRVDNFRKGCWRLAGLMVSEGCLPDTDLIAFFQLDEIKELIEFRSPALISRALHRRKAFETTLDLKFPEIMKGLPVPINFNNTSADYECDLMMKGTPVCQGTAKGYARVALSIKEAADLKPGEILIAYSTDIGWSPYFPILAGVVTELGGLISHGAVVSREYGLPCIVGLHGATKRFKTGDYVLIDGKKGILQRLPLPS